MGKYMSREKIVFIFLCMCSACSRVQPSMQPPHFLPRRSNPPLVRHAKTAATATDTICNGRNGPKF
eukprot:758684-Hanusia_phi.AAC.13